jgi:hypothetical protein
MGLLESLVEINFEFNRFHSKIPSEIGMLDSNLEILSLSWNQFDGSLPSEVGFLSNLRELNIEDGSLTGSVPTEIGNLLRVSSGCNVVPMSILNGQVLLTNIVCSLYYTVGKAYSRSKTEWDVGSYSVRDWPYGILTNSELPVQSTGRKHSNSIPIPYQASEAHHE